MIIGTYIKELLEARKRVILPGFGNLELKEQGGAKTPAGGKLTPPGMKVVFDQSYSKDDGQLSKVIVTGERMDLDEASQRVLELVDAIKFALDKGESYEIADAGSFHKDGDGKITFVHDPAWTLEPDQFGLETMDLLELEEDKPVEASTKLADPEPAAPKPAAPKAEAPKPAPESEKPKKEAAKAEAPKITAPKTGEEKKPVPASGKASDKPVTKLPAPPGQKKAGITDLAPKAPEKKRKPRRAIWIVSGALLVILVALLLLPPDTMDKISRAFPFLDRGVNPVQVDTELPDQVNAEELGGELDSESVEGMPEGNGETEDTPEPEEIEVLEEPAPVVEYNYFIIAGSFSNVDNASDLQDHLIRQGFESEVMLTEDRMYRVSVASYATKKEANQGLYQIRGEPGLENAWLLSN